MSKFEIIVKPHPLKLDTYVSDMDVGMTLLEAVGEDVDDTVRASIEGEYIPRELWARLKPKAGTSITVIRYPRSDSAKKIIGVVLLIVIAIFAPYLAPWLVATFGIGATAAAVIAVGITLLATMAAYALIPPPEVPKIQGSGSGDEFNRLNAITGTSNQATPYGSIPMVIGQCRYYPTFAANPFTEIIGDQQYLRMMLDLGFGNLTISDILIGETSIDDFDDVEYEIEETPELFSDDMFELGLTDAFNNGAIVPKTSQTNSDELSLDIVFPQGLFSVDNKGKSVTGTTSFLLEFRLLGSGGAWTNTATLPATSRTSSTYACQPSGSTWRISSSARKVLRLGIRWKLPARGQYEIRATRYGTTWGSGSEATARYDTAQLVTFRSIKHTNPSTTGTTKLAIRIKATDQLNGVINQLSVVGTQLIPVWNGTTWSAPTANFNPAWIYCWLMTSCPGVAITVPTSRMDLPVILEWANVCTTMGFTAKGMLDRGVSFDALLRLILSAGRASFAMRDGKYSVLYDKDNLVPVQHFSQSNSKGFKGQRTFIDLPHGLRVKFQNPALNWQEDEIIVLTDEYSYDGLNARGIASGLPAASKFETLTLPYVTEPRAAWQIARYHLAQGIFRPNIYTFDTDVENLICTRGDLVYATNEVTNWGVGFGRIANLTRNGSDQVTSIIVAEPIVVVGGETYSIRVRDKQNNAYVSTLTAMAVGEQTVFTPTVPMSALIDSGDMYMVGTTNNVIRQLLITRIQPGADLTATIEAVEYSAAVVAYDDSPPSSFVSAISGTAILEPPPPPNIYAVFSADAGNPVNDGGTSTPNINVGVDPGPSGYYNPGGNGPAGNNGIVRYMTP